MNTEDTKNALAVVATSTAALGVNVGGVTGTTISLVAAAPVVGAVAAVAGVAAIGGGLYYFIQKDKSN